MTKFRPCIDLHNGQVKQIVGGTLSERDESLKTNFISEKPPSYYAQLYKDNSLTGAHVIKLGKNNDEAALEAIKTWHNELQLGGGINLDNADYWLEQGARQVIVTSWLFPGAEFDEDRLRKLVEKIGRDKLVIDLSYLKAKLNQQELDKTEIHMDPFPVEYKASRHSSPKKKSQPPPEEDYSSGSNFWKIAQNEDAKNDIPLKSMKSKVETEEVFVTKGNYAKPDSSVAKLLKKIKQHEIDGTPVEEKTLKEGEIWYFDNLSRTRISAKLICNSHEQYLKVYTIDGSNVLATVNLSNVYHVGSEIGVEPKFIVQTIAKSYTFGVDSVTHRDTWIKNIKRYVKDKQEKAYEVAGSTETLTEEESFSNGEVLRISELSTSIAARVAQIGKIVQMRLKGNNVQLEDLEILEDDSNIGKEIEILSQKMDVNNDKLLTEIVELKPILSASISQADKLDLIKNELSANEKRIKILMDKVESFEKNFVKFAQDAEGREPNTSGASSYIQIDRPTKNIIVSMNDKLIQLARLQEHTTDSHSSKLASLDKKLSVGKSIDAKEMLDQLSSIQKTLESRITKLEKQIYESADNQKHIISLLQSKTSTSSNSSDSDDDHVQNLKEEFQEFKQLWRNEQRLSKDRMSQLVNMFSMLQDAHSSILTQFKALDLNEMVKVKDKVDGIESKVSQLLQQKENSEQIISQIHKNIVSFLPLNLESKLFNIEQTLNSMVDKKE
ncbi:Enzyme that catalyzes the fourth step in the histidine pathway [Boothiomyces sp. JEL0838]|nr:Enzyme that catalyzes the fourth step in the histidine pathway [Boothiomyces sp. JEL0838]